MYIHDSAAPRRPLGLLLPNLPPAPRRPLGPLLKNLPPAPRRPLGSLLQNLPPALMCLMQDLTLNCREPPCLWCRIWLQNCREPLADPWDPCYRICLQPESVLHVVRLNVYKRPALKCDSVDMTLVANTLILYTHCSVPTSSL